MRKLGKMHCVIWNMRRNLANKPKGSWDTVKITVEDRVGDSVGYILLNRYCTNLDGSSEYDLKNFPNVFRSLWYKPVLIVLK